MGATNTEQFIVKSKRFHGEHKFGYDRVVYRGAKEPVELFCFKCNVYFMQKPNDHYRGGHEECSKNKPYTIESVRQYIEDRPEEFETIELLSTEYKSAREPLQWRCKLCEREYHANWDNTRRCGKRCRPCGMKKLCIPKETVLVYIEKYKHKFQNIVLHNIDAYEKVSDLTLKCLSCGDEWKPAWTYIQKITPTRKTTTPCKICQIEETRISIEDLHTEIKNNPAIFKNVILLSTEIQATKDSLDWQCTVCGHIRHTQWHHIKGGPNYAPSGCPECLRRSLPGYYNLTRAEKKKDIWEQQPTKLYVISCLDSDTQEQFYKIGLAKNTNIRFNSKASMPYTFTILYELNTNLYKAIYVENYLHNIADIHSYSPRIFFKGHTECFSEIPPIEEIEKHIQDVLTSIENNTHRDQLQ